MKVKVVNGTLSKQEIEKYQDYVVNQNPNRRIDTLEIKVDGDYVELTTKFARVPFQRIRRITGYLVGTMDRFNSAKATEVQERVKHQI